MGKLCRSGDILPDSVVILQLSDVRSDELALAFLGLTWVKMLSLRLEQIHSFDWSGFCPKQNFPSLGVLSNSVSIVGGLRKGQKILKISMVLRNTKSLGKRNCLPAVSHLRWIINIIDICQTESNIIPRKIYL